MNSNPTIPNQHSNHIKGTRPRCQCCGHPLSKSKSTQANTKRPKAKPFKSLRAIIEAETEKEAAVQRAQRLIDRADYLHLIPVSQRSLYLPEDEELRYQCLRHWELATPEQRLIMSQPSAQDIELDNYLRKVMKRRAEVPFLLQQQAKI